jgi:hypothetical protein
VTARVPRPAVAPSIGPATALRRAALPEVTREQVPQSERPVESLLESKSGSARGSETQIQPLLVKAKGIPAATGIPGRTWRALNAAGLCPRARKVGGRRYWSSDELRAWVAAGCPNRERWESMSAVASTPPPPRGSTDKTTRRTGGRR